jgi:hypothetical protein
MWTAESRALVGDFGAGQALSDERYALLTPLIPPAKPGGRPRTTDMRRLLDGLFYLVRTGCQWRHLPPPPAFSALADGVRLHARLCGRRRVGEHAPPARDDAARAGRPGGQPHCRDHRYPERQDDRKRGPRGWDAAKKVKGRKRHIAADTSGLLLGVAVHAADVQDADGAGDLLKRLKRLYPWLKIVFGQCVRPACGPARLLPARPDADRRPAPRRDRGLCPPPAPLGGRADAGLARPMAPPLQGVRRTSRGLRDHGQARHDPAHAAPPRSPEPEAATRRLTSQTAS